MVDPSGTPMSNQPPATQVIDPNGSVRLLRDTTSNLVSVVSNGVTTALRYQGAQVKANQFTGWQILAAETTGTNQNQILWKELATGRLHFWSVDSNWNYVSSGAIFDPSSAQGLLAQQQFMVDPSGTPLTSPPPTTNTTNHPGTITISGTVTQNQTLTAMITDLDGLPATINYQWQQSSNGTTWSAITGATARTLTLQQAQVGQRVRATASYVDLRGANETLSSAPTAAAVLNVNDPGMVSISGTPTQGQVLTAAVVDPDGLPGTINYQWQQSSNGTTWNAITGAMAPSLTLQQAQVGQRVRAVAFYRDLAGTAETLTSTPTATVVDDVIPGAFREDFNGSTIDQEVWKVASWREHGGQTGPERAYVRDGYLHLELINDTTQGILSSAIETWQKFGFGRWEARLKPSDVPGVLNSFYTIDWDDYSTPNTPADGTKQEIDIEFLTRSFNGDTGEVHFAVHAQGRQSMDINPDITLNFNPSKEFHVYGFDIKPDRIEWHIDGQRIYTYEYARNDITIDSSYQLKLNTWTMPAWIGGPPQPGVKSIYLIDWINFTPYSGSEPVNPPEPLPDPQPQPTPLPVPTPDGALNLPLDPWWGGPSYYEQFSVAAQTEWVSPEFFPIAVFYGKPEHAAQLRSVGINTYMRAENPQLFSSVDIMTNEGMYLLLQDGWTPEKVGNDPHVVGWHISEELDMASLTNAEKVAAQQSSAAARRALNDGRFLQSNFGNGVLNTYWANGIMDDLIAEVDLTSVDKYAYTSPQVRYEFNRTPDWGLGGPASESASAYGWQQNQMEKLGAQLNGVPRAQKPNWVFVETAMPYLFSLSGDGSREPGAETIRPEEIEGAVWNAIINGASGIAYFQHNNDATNGNYSLVTGDPARLAKVTAINAQVQRMAPIINTQSYVWSFGSGLDTMLKVYAGNAYIFAMTTGGTGARTFTLPGGISGTTVEVVDEGRTLTVTNGSFTDTFAAEHEHHIYRVALD
jgi:beta-glucanase (GH16 family)